MTTGKNENPMRALKAETIGKVSEQKQKTQRKVQVRVTPTEAKLNRLSRRLQEALAESGISLEQALKNLDKIRQRRFRRLYGKQ